VADPQFVIDGTAYDVPMLASLSMAESMLFYEYAKFSPLDLEDMTPPALAALMHIAMKRGSPDLRDTAIRQKLDGVNFHDLVVSLSESFKEQQAEEEAEERPPTSPTPTGNESSTGSVGNEIESTPSTEPPSSESSDHSPDLHVLRRTGTPV
jgi:hypothetical protein